jgi:hypothetical protein
MMRSRIQAPAVFRETRAALTPDDSVMHRVWTSFVLPRLQPAYQTASTLRPVQWIAVTVAVVLVVRGMPMLFLAPDTIADSPVLLLPTSGSVEVLTGPLTQSISNDLTLTDQTRLETGNGTATIILHDDAVFRLASDTRVALLDLSDRPAYSLQDTTLTLEAGKLWILGLVPKHLHGITVVTTQGLLTVHEGSVSVEQQADGSVVVQVLDRSATISRHNAQITLVTGQQAVLTKDAPFVATNMNASLFQESWISTNLSRDAAHQHEIAQLQQERRAASAGILPGSAFYPVKRLAEKVDVLLSFSDEERARKLITQANTRLNEAAALLQDDGDANDAQNAMHEYRDTLLQVATGSGGNMAVQDLLEKEVVEAGSATVAAALPGDPAYALKQAVDETIAALPENVPKPDVQGEVLLDQLTVLKRQAEQGDTAGAQEKLNELSDSIDTINATGALTLIAQDVREEAQAAIRQVTTLSLGVPEKEFVTPEHPVRQVVTTTVRPLTPEQVTEKAQEIRGRIFAFGTKKAQYDSLVDQLALLRNSPDRGRILRELSRILPRNGLAQRVIREMRDLQDSVNQEMEDIDLHQATESGDLLDAQ